MTKGSKAPQVQGRKSKGSKVIEATRNDRRTVMFLRTPTGTSQASCLGGK